MHIIRSDMNFTIPGTFICTHLRFSYVKNVTQPVHISLYDAPKMAITFKQRYLIKISIIVLVKQAIICNPSSLGKQAATY